MNSLLQLQAVVESPSFQGEFQCPWDVPQFKPFSWIRLSGEMTYQEIGLVFAQLIQYNHLDLSGESQVVLKRVLEAQGLILPGGIQVVFGNKSISPSCCCGLETWREWQDYLKTGQSPWLGHNPSPWIEKQGELVCIWSDGGMGEPLENVFHIDVLHSVFQDRLRIVEKDLQAFLYCIGSWAQEIGFEQSENLFQKFDQCFDIRYSVPHPNQI
jgi:hypothetical protein